MKFPIGIQSFERIIEGGFVYVDKTAIIYNLTHESNIYFLSRPRRFGKSLLVSTLETITWGAGSCSRDWPWRSWKRNGMYTRYFM